MDLNLVAGQIDLVAGPEGKVSIHVVQTLGDANDHEAGKAFDSWDFDFGQKAGVISLDAGSRKLAVWDWEAVRRMQCQVVITAPAASELRVAGVQLQVNVDELDGNLVAKLDRGAVFARRVSGNVGFKADSGQLSLSSVSGNVDYSVNAGQLLVGTATGPIRARSDGGLVEIQQAAGGVDVRGDTLDIHVGLANPANADSTLRTAVGGIVLKVEQTADLLIDAKAPWLGEVNARGLKLDVQSGRVGSSRLMARLNDGGAKVEMRASGGTVSIIGLEPLGTPVAALER